MQIQQIHVEGFGTLADTRLSPLGAGLTVLYGNNGAGKTTVLEFLRGVLCGFDHSRRLRLLPPLKEGTPGGSLVIQNSRGQFEVIRHARNDGSDTLAIAQQRGSANDVAQLRETIRNLDEQAIRTLFMVSGYDAVNFKGQVSLAQRYGVELQSHQVNANWITPRFQKLKTQRDTLFQSIAPQGDLAQLEQRRKELKAAVEKARQAQANAIQNWRKAISQLESRLDTLRKEVLWLAQEQGAVESDLTEVQTRLWSTREIIVEELETIEETVPAPAAEWKKEIVEIDREIANAQQVLRDLAGSRMNLSVTKAQFAGSETPDAEITFERQRIALAAIEQQTNKLAELAERLRTASECLCGSHSDSLKESAQELQSQLWVLCQELSRQQSAQRQWMLETERAGVDGCEMELTRQIRRLRIRREELLERIPTTAERLRHRSPHDSAWCRCEGHEQAVELTAEEPEFIVTPKVISYVRTVVTSDARPDDAEREQQLKNQLVELRNRWLNSISSIRSAELELERLHHSPSEITYDRTLQNLKYELNVVQQELRDGHSQWHHLKLTESILERTQSALHVDIVPPVIQEASALLSKMTSGSSTAIRFDPRDSELKVIPAAGGELGASALSRGTLEQASLCFRLALVREFHRLGHAIPLVLDDVLIDSDERRCRAAVEVLIDAARYHQILFLTCQEHLLELLDEYQVQVLGFPGSPRPSREAKSNYSHAVAGFVLAPISSTEAKSSTSAAAEVLAETEETVPAIEPPIVEVAMTKSVESASSESPLEVKRLQPETPYWLQISSPVNLIPSLGSQMVRRLSTIGVRDVCDLIELEPELLEIPLDSLQISTATLRQWQAEGRLLCCVPNLTGRDAQVIVLCGIQTPAELAQIDIDELYNAVSKLRVDSKSTLALPWLSEQDQWLSEDQVSKWIDYAKHALSWRALRDAAAGSRRSIRRSVHSGLENSDSVIAAPHVRLHDHSAGEEEKELRFYLTTESNVVDAPSIGPRMAERLNQIGIHLVSDLLAMSAKEIASKLVRRDVKIDTIADWQKQAILVCRVPHLRGHDAQVLVACKISDPKSLAAMAPADLFKKVKPFVHSKDGQRVLRSAKTPDLKEVTEWIENARRSPALRAA